MDAISASSNPAIQQAVQPRAQQESVDVQSLLRNAISKTSGNATVTVQYGYGVSADGSLQVTSATVSTTEKTLNGEPVTSSKQPTAPALTQTPLLQISPQVQAEIFSLSQEEQAVLRELQSSDAEVRAHEALHFRAGAGITSGTPEYTLVQGPDGNYYAVGGGVNVQTTSGADSERQAREAQTFSNAATAPGDASAQDLNAARNFALSQGIAAYRNTLGEQSNSSQETESSQNPLDISV